MSPPTRSLRYHIVLALVAKLAMLALLYLFFFSPAHRPAIDPTALFGLAVSVR
ncbi:MAG TPA: hypothetical protein VMI52_02325 [Acetobacteraceae bacterium]|nr:hypothetical protein [Acetobacteraceae bacterium]